MRWWWGGGVAVIAGADAAPCCQLLSTATCTLKLTNWETAAFLKSIKRVCAFLFQSAAAAPSPVMGNMPPNDAMPGGPMPPGFFQVRPAPSVTGPLTLPSLHYLHHAHTAVVHPLQKQTLSSSLYTFTVFLLDSASSSSPKLEK